MSNGYRDRMRLPSPLVAPLAVARLLLQERGVQRGLILIAPAGVVLDLVERDDVGIHLHDPVGEAIGIVDAIGAVAAMVAVPLQDAERAARCRRLFRRR